MPWLNDLTTLMTDVGMTLGRDLHRTTKAQPPILASGEATLTIVDTSNGAPERIQNAVIRPKYIRVGAQFMARADSYEAARAKAQTAYDQVVGIRNCWIVSADSLASGWYREITPSQEPFDAGVDDRGQARCGFNVTGVKRR